MIRKFGGSSGVEFQPQGLDIGVGGGSNIKSIQRGVSTVNSNLLTDVTISAVDLTKSIVVISFSGNVASQANYILTKAELTSATNLRLSIGEHNNQISVSWQVIEFNNVKSIQRGSVDLAANSTNITIASVNLSKSIVFINQYTQAETVAAFARASLTAATTITIATNTNAYADSAHWQVIEFN